MKKIMLSIIVISLLILSATMQINALELTQEDKFKPSISDHLKNYENGDIETGYIDENLLVSGEDSPDLMLLDLKACWGYNLNKQDYVLYVKFYVRNIGGTYPNGICNIGFYADGAKDPFVIDVLDPSFGGPAWEHWETLMYSKYYYDLDVKPNNVTAKADCKNKIPESNENNNEKTCGVPYAINVSGYVYNKNDDGNLISIYKCHIMTGKIPLFDGNEGDRSNFTMLNGYFHVIIFPYEPFDQPQDYHILASFKDENDVNRRQMKTVQNKAGDNVKLDFIFQGKPPRNPIWPIGTPIARVGSSYTFSSFAFDIDKNDEIYYMFDWGDGTYSYWLGPYKSWQRVEASHIWTYKSSRILNIREIRFLTRDSYDNLSPISKSALVFLI